MRRDALVVILLVALSGCARLQGILSTLPPAEQPAPATPVPPVPVTRPTPPPPLTPEMSTDKERQLLEEAQRKIGETDRLLRQLDGRPLKPQERETLLIAQRFLAEARKAIEAKEYQRAANLVGKAQALGDDLAKATK